MKHKQSIAGLASAIIAAGIWVQPSAGAVAISISIATTMATTARLVKLTALR